MKSEIHVVELRSGKDFYVPPIPIPYKTFSFRKNPFRWLFCWLLWNLGECLVVTGRSLSNHLPLITITLTTLYFIGLALIAITQPNLGLTIILIYVIVSFIRNGKKL